jgi:hypothetical protein
VSVDAQNFMCSGVDNEQAGTLLIPKKLIIFELIPKAQSSGTKHSQKKIFFIFSGFLLLFF